jgi:hypothetical protein
VNEDALDRVQRALMPGTLDGLSGLPGTDLTTAMLELSRRRAARLSPSDVLGRYEHDRFVRPGGIPAATVREVERELFDALPEGVDEVALSPVVPVGTHGIGGVVQSRVLTTDRGPEVAADPTNGLALEAAIRRRALLTSDPRSPDVVRLAASQRVVRAQRFDDEAAFSHFQLFGLVSAGRDRGDLACEREELVVHLRYLVDGIRRVTDSTSRVALTDLTDGLMGPVMEAVHDALPQAEVVLDPRRKAGRGYYGGVCFKVHVTSSDVPFEVADGGFVDWTQQLLGNRKERLLISGLGVERLVMTAGRPPRAPD